MQEKQSNPMHDAKTQQMPVFFYPERDPIAEKLFQELTQKPNDVAKPRCIPLRKFSRCLFISIGTKESEELERRIFNQDLFKNYENKRYILKFNLFLEISSFRLIILLTIIIVFQKKKLYSKKSKKKRQKYNQLSQLKISL